MKKILFICKHNIFRSRVAEILFKRMNKNKNYLAGSAGLIEWNKKDLKKDQGYIAEKKVAKKFGINLKGNSKGLNSSILKDTDILVIVADDVPPSLFKKEKIFNGRIIVWKTKDVKAGDKNKEKVAEKSIEYIQKRVEQFVKSLK